MAKKIVCSIKYNSRSNFKKSLLRNQLSGLRDLREIHRKSVRKKFPQGGGVLQSPVSTPCTGDRGLPFSELMSPN